MNIPTIGGTRGIFEIFVPDVFLLVNIGGLSWLSSGTSGGSGSRKSKPFSQPASGTGLCSKRLPKRDQHYSRLSNGMGFFTAQHAQSAKKTLKASRSWRSSRFRWAFQAKVL